MNEIAVLNIKDASIHILQVDKSGYRLGTNKKIRGSKSLDLVLNNRDFQILGLV